MRRLHDNANTELVAVLEKLLADDTDITVREVARCHPTLHNASAFTRNSNRLALIERARQRQTDARHVNSAPHVEKAATLSEQLAKRTEEVARLEAQIKALVASHAACVHAVMLAGGMNALERFWKKYKVIGSAVREMNAVPSGARVIKLPETERAER